MLNVRYGAALAVAMLAAAGCDDDCSPNTTPNGVEMVRISGICRSVDDASLAVGVRVSLLDTNHADEFPTGDDGAYSLQVPKGSTLWLHADDFDADRGADEWFPLVNVDQVIANEDIVNWDIHACPNTVCPDRGSIAAWDNYLQNADDDNGDLYSVTSSAETSGIIAALYIEIENDGVVGFLPGVSATVSSPSFVPGYLEAGRFFPKSGPPPDCSLGPEILQPGGGTQTSSEGAWIAFGEPDYDGDEVLMILTDQERDLEWDPVEIPIRPATISLIVNGTIDGESNNPFNDQCVAWGVECPIFGSGGRTSR